MVPDPDLAAAGPCFGHQDRNDRRGRRRPLARKRRAGARLAGWWRSSSLFGRLGPARLGSTFYVSLGLRRRLDVRACSPMSLEQSSPAIHRALISLGHASFLGVGRRVRGSAYGLKLGLDPRGGRSASRSPRCLAVAPRLRPGRRTAVRELDVRDPDAGRSARSSGASPTGGVSVKRAADNGPGRHRPGPGARPGRPHRQHRLPTTSCFAGRHRPCARVANCGRSSARRSASPCGGIRGQRGARMRTLGLQRRAPHKYLAFRDRRLLSAGVAGILFALLQTSNGQPHDGLTSPTNGHGPSRWVVVGGVWGRCGDRSSGRPSSSCLQQFVSIYVPALGHRPRGPVRARWCSSARNRACGGRCCACSALVTERAPAAVRPFRLDGAGWQGTSVTRRRKAVSDAPAEAGPDPDRGGGGRFGGGARPWPAVTPSPWRRAPGTGSSGPPTAPGRRPCSNVISGELAATGGRIAPFFGQGTSPRMAAARQGAGLGEWGGRTRSPARSRP